jgi:DNA-binding CsgD family transcriptional regulator
VRTDADPELLLTAVRAAARGQSMLDPTIAGSVLQEIVRGTAVSPDLTERELTVLRQLAHGKTNREIAADLVVSEETVKTHVGNILSKLQMNQRTQSVIAAPFPHVTAQYLPGWVFNVATLVHGEEAFLAAVFLFTVHFFNNHFRPDKLPPPDVVMFTGTQSLQEFRHEHPAHYQRLVAVGELEKYLVDAPSRPMHVGSVILGLLLIGVGLGLLVLVGIGFFGG